MQNTTAVQLQIQNSTIPDTKHNKSTTLDTKQNSNSKDKAVTELDYV